MRLQMLKFPEFENIEELKSRVKDFKKKLSRYWDLASVLIGFVAFAFALSGLSKSTSPIYLIFIEAAITGGVIGFIASAFRNAAYTVLDGIVQRAERESEKKAAEKPRDDVL